MSNGSGPHGERVTVAPQTSKRGFIKVPEMRQQLDEAIMDRPGDVVVDLRAVRRLDAVAIAVIAISSDRLRETGRRLVVHGTSRRQERSMRRRGLLVPGPRSSPEKGSSRGSSAA